MKITIITTPTSVLFCFTSCYVTEHIPNKYMISPITEVKCDSPIVKTDFFSYFNGEKIDFEYTPISMMNVTRGNDTHVDMLYELKNSAYKQCADGVINIMQDMDEGKYKVNDISWENDHRNNIEYRSYTIHKYSGMAVKLKNKGATDLRIDSLFIQQLSVNKEKEKIARIQESKVEEGPSKQGLLIAILALSSILGVFIYEVAR